MTQAPTPTQSETKPHHRYQVWLKQANFDLEAAKISYEHNFYEWTAYQAEQAVEKALKAILVHAGWRPPKMHKLPVLLGIANQVNKQVSRTKFNFKHLESFTFISRYPFLLPEKHKSPHELIKKEDAYLAYEQARDFLQKIGDILQSEEEVAEPLVRQQPSTLYNFTPEQINKRLEEVKQILIKEFDPEQIILFGSFAHEDKPHVSTADLMIVANTDLEFIQRIKVAREATRGELPVIEPLVYTPEELKLLQEEEEGFLQDALEEGKVIYQKSSAHEKLP